MHANYKLIGSILLLAIGMALFMQQIVYNPTISIPKGYYFTYSSKNYKVHDLVLLCVWDERQLKIMHLLHLPYANDACIHNSPYLIKEIIALANDVVEITPKGIVVNGYLYPNSHILPGYKQIVFTSLPQNKFRLQANEFFVLGQTPHSYDSRYFGVIKQEQIYRKGLLLLRANHPII